MLLRQNTHNTGNNAIEMSQVFHKHFTDQCHLKLENGCFTVLIDGAYFLLAVMVEGDESRRLRMAN